MDRDRPRIAFVASESELARESRARLARRYGDAPVEQAEVIVALGGDGFMLDTLHANERGEVPVYGMNRGTVGFLMNECAEDGLVERLAAAEEARIHPLKMRAGCTDGRLHEALAINEVSLLRAGSQAARLRITIDGRTRLEALACDGALVSTPAGSTAYNFSAHGPILPIGSEVLALTPIAAFRPRRWRGALVPASSKVRFEVLSPHKRAVMADADSRGAGTVLWVEVETERQVRHRLLFDPGHGLEERILREQFL